jgi:hypothetical protein
MSEGEALKKEDSLYYDELQVRLDLVLTFTELGVFKRRYWNSEHNVLNLSR